MKLVAMSMIKNEEYWIWYSLSSVYTWVDHILVFDNFSEDKTLEIVRGMDHIADKLVLIPEFGGESENENREFCLDACRKIGGTHVLFLDGDEVHADEDLSLARRILEVQEHKEPLCDPPENHGEVENFNPTDGCLIKQIGFKPVHPGFAGLRTSIPQDHLQPDNDHSCYNFAIRIAALDGLHGNGKEWGEHGFLQKDDIYIQSSAQTLWCPGLHYYHFTHHPRSSLRVPGAQAPWVRPVQDLGSTPLRAGAHVPQVLFRPDGPTNPSLEGWGMKPLRA